MATVTGRVQDLDGEGRGGDIRCVERVHQGLHASQKLGALHVTGTLLLDKAYSSPAQQAELRLSAIHQHQVSRPTNVINERSAGWERTRRVIQGCVIMVPAIWRPVAVVDSIVRLAILVGACAIILHPIMPAAPLHPYELAPQLQSS